MQGELSRILALVFLGFLVVLYGAIEACIWLSGRFSRTAAERREASEGLELGRASDIELHVGDVHGGGA